MKGLFSFLKSKYFFVHFGLIIGLFVILFFGLVKGLSSYTHHNQFTKVPDFRAKNINNLAGFVNGKDITYQIIDSIYDPKEKPGTVIRQEPEAGAKVKYNRTIYLYVTGMVAPQIQMPRLVDRSERQARLIIETYGLKVGKISEKSADCNGCVLAQLQNGKEIAAGKNVKKGSTISLIVGRKNYSYTNSASDTLSNDKPDFDNGGDD
jgi:eukaryotic-like serine/threonine-protein kinase